MRAKPVFLLLPPEEIARLRRVGAGRATEDAVAEHYKGVPPLLTRWRDDDRRARQKVAVMLPPPLYDRLCGISDRLRLPLSSLVLSALLAHDIVRTFAADGPPPKRSLWLGSGDRRARSDEPIPRAPSRQGVIRFTGAELAALSALPGETMGAKLRALWASVDFSRVRYVFPGVPVTRSDGATIRVPREVYDDAHDRGVRLSVGPRVVVLSVLAAWREQGGA